jgi:hypothetical protein
MYCVSKLFRTFVAYLYIDVIYIDVKYLNILQQLLYL